MTEKGCVHGNVVDAMRQEAELSKRITNRNNQDEPTDCLPCKGTELESTISGDVSSPRHFPSLGR